MYIVRSALDNVHRMFQLFSMSRVKYSIQLYVY
jgi:hypothetical protein